MVAGRPSASGAGDLSRGALADNIDPSKAVAEFQFTDPNGDGSDRSVYNGDGTLIITKATTIGTEHILEGTVTATLTSVIGSTTKELKDGAFRVREGCS